MRIALLTAMARLPGSDQRRAFRRFLGRSVLSHQVDCAIELGCDSILCMVDGVGQDLIESQHRAEAAKVRFQTIADTRTLSSLVRADDELIVLSDGLLPDPDLIGESLGDRRALLSFPADPAVTRGFERIDANRAWAGVMTVRGDCVERLAQLPPDVEAASALMRIALQSGVRTVPLDPAVLSEGRWEVARDAHDQAEREQAWIGKHVVAASFAAPGRAIAERIGMRLARDIVGRKSERIPLLLSIAAGLLAGVAGLLGRPLIGLLFALPMVFGIPVATVIERVSRIGGRIRNRLPLLRLLHGATDLLIVALLAMVLPGIEEAGWLRLFIAAQLILALRVGQRFGRGWFKELAGDRILLVSILAAAALTGYILPVTAGMALATLGCLLVLRTTTD